MKWKTQKSNLIDAWLNEEYSRKPNYSRFIRLKLCRMNKVGKGNYFVLLLYRASSCIKYIHAILSKRGELYVFTYNVYKFPLETF